MKRVTQILSMGLLLTISSVALAGGGNHRNDQDGNYGGRHHNTHQNERYGDHHGHRHYVNNNRHNRGHSHQWRYCNDWHPHGYVAPRMHASYRSSGLVIVYQPSAGLYIGGGR